MEVYAVYAVGTGSWVGADKTGDRAMDGCVERFEAFIGISYEESNLEVYAIYPTPESWRDGDRTAICSVLMADGSPLVGSMKGSGR